MAVAVDHTTAATQGGTVNGSVPTAPNSGVLGVTPAAGATPTNSNAALIQALSQPGYIQGTAGYNPATASYDPAQQQSSNAYHAQYNGGAYRGDGGYNDPASFNNAQYGAAQTGQLNQGLLNSLGVGQTLGEIQQGMAPQTMQAENSLNQQLAEFGVGGGQAIQANQQLQGQLAGSESNAMASAIQNAQGNMLGAGQFDVGQFNQQGLANAQMGMQNSQFNSSGQAANSQFNAANQLQNQQFNTSNRLQNQQFNEQNKLGVSEFNAGQNTQNSQFNAGQNNQMNLANSQNALQASLANQGAYDQAGQFNASNTNAMNQYNVGEQNQYQQGLMNAILGNYNQQMGMEGGFIGSGQEAGNQNAVNYGQTITTQDPFADIMQGVGAAAPFFG